MARVKLSAPSPVLFTTQITIGIEHLNYGAHVGNDRFLTLAHEARMRFLHSLKLKELMDEQNGLIMSDSAVVYRAEAFWADVLTIEIGIDETSATGFDLLYRFINQENTEVARAKTGLVFFDYQARKVIRTPQCYAPLMELFP
jgi:acyl-CoA thioester hydrolase